LSKHLRSFDWDALLSNKRKGTDAGIATATFAAVNIVLGVMAVRGRGVNSRGTLRVPVQILRALGLVASLFFAIAFLPWTVVGFAALAVVMAFIVGLALLLWFVTAVLDQ